MITLDIETSKIDFGIKDRAQQLRKVRFGVAVTHDEQIGFKYWLPDALQDLWEYLKTDLVVGWNILDFDIPVISYTIDSLTGFEPTGQIRTYDMFARVRAATNRWCKLELIASATIKRSKTADGLQAAEWLEKYWETNDRAWLDKTINYCIDDVTLERDLYLHLANEGPLRLPPRGERGESGYLLYHHNGEIKNL